MIVDVFTTVSTDPLIAPVLSNPSDPQSALTSGYLQLLGSEFIQANDARPRMVWWPTQGGAESGWKKLTVDGGLSVDPKSFGTRKAGITVRIFAKSSADTSGNVANSTEEIAAVEEAIRLLFGAMRRNLFGSMKYLGEVWLAQDGAPVLQYGRAVDLNFVIDIPLYLTLTEMGQANVPVENIEQEGTLGDEVEESATWLVSIDVTPVTPAVAVGETQQMTATATYSDGSTQDCTALATWVSATPAAATVDQSGLVTGIAVGSSDVSANLIGMAGGTPNAVAGSQPVDVV